MQQFITVKRDSQNGILSSSACTLRTIAKILRLTNNVSFLSE